MDARTVASSLARVLTTGADSNPYNPPVAEDKGKEEEKFDFTPAGEGLLTLGDARMLAVRTAAESPGDYGSTYQGVAMVFEVLESGEDADYYTATNPCPGRQAVKNSLY